jgi:hypothetical protein
MASALFGFTSGDESFHGFEDLVHPPEVLIEEMVAVHLQEPMISFIFVSLPVPTRLPILQNLRVFLLLPSPLAQIGTLVSCLPVELNVLENLIFCEAFIGVSDELTEQVIA